MRPQEKITGADHQALAQILLQLQAGLLRIGDAAVGVDASTAVGNKGAFRPGTEVGRSLSGQKQGPRRLRRSRDRRPVRIRQGVAIVSRAGSVKTQLVQYPGSRIVSFSNKRLRYSGYHHFTLRVGDENERHVLVVVENPEPGANDGVLGGRVGETDPRLKSAVVRIDNLGKTGFKIPAQTVIEGQTRGQAPLVLDEAPDVTMVDPEIEVLRVDIGVLPGGWDHRWQAALHDRARTDRSAPENDGHTIQRIVRIGPEGTGGEPEIRRRGDIGCGTGTIGWNRRHAGCRIHEVGQIYHAVDVRQHDAHGGESRPDHEVADEVGVHPESPVVVPLDPGQTVGDLYPAFIERIEGAEIVSERKSIRHIQVGLAGHRRKVVGPAGILHQKRIHHIRLQHGIQGTNQRLIPQVSVVAITGRANAAAVERIADQHVHVACVHNPVMDGKSVVGIELMVDLHEAVVVVEGLQDIQVFTGQTHRDFGSVDRAQVADQRLRIGRRLRQTLALIVGEEECLVFLNGGAERGAKLIAVILIVLGLGQKGAGVGGRILCIAIDRTVRIVGARLGDYVHDAAEGAAILGAETVIDHAELADRFLRGRSALRTGALVDVIGAIDGDRVAQIAHAAEGDAGDIGFGEGRLQTGAAGGHAGGEEREVNELAGGGGEGLDFGCGDDLADFGARGLDGRRFASNNHGLTGRGDAKLDIHGRRLAHRQRHPSLREL